MSRVLVTNNGAHSADKWAVTTAEMIFPLEDTTIVGERLIAAQKFQTRIAEILSGHHDNNMKEEQSKLDNNPERFNEEFEHDHHLDAAMDELIQAAQESPWADHFKKPEVQRAMREIMSQHMASASHVQRLWHADRNESEHGARYRSRAYGA